MIPFAIKTDLEDHDNCNIIVERDLGDMKKRGSLPRFVVYENTEEALIASAKAYPNENETSIRAIELTASQEHTIRTRTSLSNNSTRDTMTGSPDKPKSCIDKKGDLNTDPLNNKCSNTISRHFDTYPQGFPRLAAFQNSSSDLAIFRRFGTAHCRVLMHLQCEITSIIKDLDDLDLQDSDEEKGMLYRLRRNEWYEGWDTAQKDLLGKLQQKLAVYDDLLLKDRGLRNLESSQPQHYQSLFNWILGCKPLDGGQYDFLFHRDDFVASTANNRHNRFDNIMEKSMNRWPKSRIFQRFFRKSQTLYGSSGFGVYNFSRTKVAVAAKLLALIVAFTILLIPVFLLYLIQMSDGAKAGVVLLFVLAFGILMSLFVGAKVETVFVSTCTYCAVLVTFLGNVQVSASL